MQGRVLEKEANSRRERESVKHEMKLSKRIAIGLEIEAAHKVKCASAKHELVLYSVQVREAKRHGLPKPKNMPPRYGESLGTAAKAIGMTRMAYYCAKKVVLAAQADHQKFGDLLEQMDSGALPIVTAYRYLCKRQGIKASAHGHGERVLRHPIIAGTHHPKPNREMQRAIWSLQGLCIALERIKIEHLDATKLEEWEKDLRSVASVLRKTARRLDNGNGERNAEAPFNTPDGENFRSDD